MVRSSHCANISHTETITHCVAHPQKLGLGIKKTWIWQGKVCRMLCSTNRERRKTTSSSSYTFGPTFTGIRTWNKNKTCQQVSELLTVTDEAFIHLCLYNYSETWKAQEKRKQHENSNIQVPVSTNAV